MQQAHKTTCVANSLGPPQHRLCISLALVLIRQTILCHAVTLVYGANREYEQESERGAGDEGEEVGVGQRVDVVHLESVRDTELVDERCHELGVSLERDEGRAAIGRIEVCCRRHFDCMLDVVWRSVLRRIGMVMTSLETMKLKELRLETGHSPTFGGGFTNDVA